MSNEQTGNRNPTPHADLESNPSDAPLGKNEAPAFTAPVRITFHHARKRLADIDGLSGKAAIDGLVEAGILTDDTAQQVAEVRHYQTKSATETTRIVIEATP